MALTEEDRIVHEGMGGELGETIQELTGRCFRCLGTCNKIKKIDELYAYPHSEGLKDQKGNGWWLFYHCDKCEYNTSWRKILRRLEKTDEDQEAIEAFEVAGAMKAYGGSFVNALAEALYRADIFNIRKIKATWPDYWKQYEEIARKKKQEKDAEI